MLTVRSVWVQRIGDEGSLNHSLKEYRPLWTSEQFQNWRYSWACLCLEG